MSEAEEPTRRRNAVAEYRKKLHQHKELESRVRSVRENLRASKKEFNKTEDDLKSLQSVGRSLEKSSGHSTMNTSGALNWEFPLESRDSKTASLTISNANFPPPNSTLQKLATLFKHRVLDEVDLIALSVRIAGGHTIGMCVTFKQRLYNQNGNNQPDQTLDKGYYYNLKSVCPKLGGNNNISPLDFATPVKFDNAYFKLILWGKGLLTSEVALFTGSAGTTMQLVKRYAEDKSLSFDQFAKSMAKLGNISPLTSFKGEVRKNCCQVD